MWDGVKAQNRDLDLDQMIRKKTKRQRSVQERKSRYRNFRQYLLILYNEKSGRIAKQYNAKTNISFNIAHVSEDLAYLFLMT